MFQDPHLDESLMMKSLFVPARTMKVARCLNKEIMQHSKSNKCRMTIDTHSSREFVLGL